MKLAQYDRAFRSLSSHLSTSFRGICASLRGGWREMPGPFLSMGVGFQYLNASQKIAERVPLLPMAFRRPAQALDNSRNWQQMKKSHAFSMASILAGMVAGAMSAHAEDAQELAKKLSNPIASLISVPFQYNYDHRIGPADDGAKHVVNFQPVVPVSLDADWNLISRTIVPIVADQRDLFPGAGDQAGLGDVLQSFFFSPKQPTNGIIWGVGPVLLLPAGTHDLLSTEKWGAGPTAVALTQQSGWTVGILANHLWSFAGDSDRADVDQTFMQPFVSYTTADAWTFSLNSESTYDWTADEWSVPINLSVTKLIKVGQQPISLGGGVRYWADSSDTGPEGWGARGVVTFLFPTGG